MKKIISGEVKESKPPKKFNCSHCGIVFISDEYHTSMITMRDWDTCPNCKTKVISE